MKHSGGIALRHDWIDLVNRTGSAVPPLPLEGRFRSRTQTPGRRNTDL
jgi:hypothetical protein